MPGQINIRLDTGFASSRFAACLLTPLRRYDAGGTFAEPP